MCAISLLFDARGRRCNGLDEYHTTNPSVVSHFSRIVCQAPPTMEGLGGTRIVAPYNPMIDEPGGSCATEGLRLAELLTALSLATDLGMGQPLEHALRSCLIAIGLSERLRLRPEELAEV